MGHTLTHQSAVNLAKLLRRDRFAVDVGQSREVRDSWPDVCVGVVQSVITPALQTDSATARQSGKGNVKLSTMDADTIVHHVDPVTVRSWHFRAYVPGERILVAQAPDGQYWVVDGSPAALFLTPPAGIPAMTSSGGEYVPGSASCTRHILAVNASGAVRINPTSPTVSETVWNAVASLVPGGKLIQAKMIDARWVVDVVPC
jgi:hypothetical protein